MSRIALPISHIAVVREVSTHNLGVLQMNEIEKSFPVAVPVASTPVDLKFVPNVMV